MLKFITGNKDKFDEVKKILPEIEQLKIDLPEIQEIDPKKIIEAKIKEASKHHLEDIFVEDQSLHMDCLNGLPGPFIKWFEKSLGNQGLFELAKKLGNIKASNRIMVGYRPGTGSVKFFEAVVNGEIVEPKGNKDFGWGPIFKPDGSDKTYGEMNKEEKAPFNPRIIAAKLLADYLIKKD